MIRTIRSIGLTALVSMLALAVTAAIQNERRDPESYARGLERPERVERMEVDRVVAALALQPGRRVADLGTGSGLFARPMARAVAPDGLVYAIDIDPALLRIVERLAAEAGLTNIRTVEATATDPNLPSPVDLIFICDAFHHLPDKPAYAKTLASNVVPGGRVAIIDFTDDWPGGHHAMRYTPAQLDEWMTAAGFTRDQSFEFPENSFFVIYVRQ